jgi:flagellar motor switch protein FliN/FliY
MNVDDALIKLGESTSEAVASVMQMYAGDAAQPGPIAIVTPGSDPLGALPTPAVTASVSYVDGVTGGNVFVMPLKGARALAAAMMGEAPPEDDEATELTELELSAAGEAMNQMMAAAANATAAVLGTEVEIGVPDVRVLDSLSGALEGHDDAAHVTSAVFTVFGEPCRLVQLVPNAFVMRMTKALDELGAEYLGDQVPSISGESLGIDESLRGVPVRVWAELGRSAASSGHRPARSSRSIARPTSRSICTSTACGSRPPASSSPTTASGRCGSRAWSERSRSPPCDRHSSRYGPGRSPDRAGVPTSECPLPPRS